MKRSPTEWEKIFANKISDKGLIPKLYKDVTQLNIFLIQLKMFKGSGQTFLQRRYTDGQQAHEKMRNITNHQGNTNENHNEIISHLSEWL